MLMIKNIETGEIEHQGDSYEILEYIQQLLFGISPAAGGWTPFTDCREQSKENKFEVFLDIYALDLGELIEGIKEDIIMEEHRITYWKEQLQCDLSNEKELERTASDFLDAAIKSWEEKLEVNLWDDEAFWHRIQKLLKIQVVDKVISH